MNNNNLVTLMQQCDDLATRYWQLGARDRELAYKLWKNQVQKTVDFIDVYEKKCKKTA